MHLIKEIKAALHNLQGAKADEKKGLLVAGMVFLLIAGYCYFKDSISLTFIFGIPAAIFPIAAVVGGVIRRKVYVAWMSVSVIIGAVGSRVLLTIVFFVLITPIAVILKILGKDILSMKKSGDSFWVKKDDYTTNYIKKY